MCVIVDANVANTIFGQTPSDGERRLRRWLESGSSRLTVGGTKLSRELSVKLSKEARRWLALASTRGALLVHDDFEVDQVEESLIKGDLCESDDQHIIGLAQISGARLLYSDDGALRRDFLDRILVNRPVGKLYPIDGNRQQQETLLNNGTICVSNRCRRRD